MLDSIELFTKAMHGFLLDGAQLDDCIHVLFSSHGESFVLLVMITFSLHVACMTAGVGELMFELDKNTYSSSAVPTL